MGVGVIVSFMQIFQLGILFLIPSILAAVVSIYFFICIFSLYKVFKTEKMKPVPHSDYENVQLRNR